MNASDVELVAALTLGAVLTSPVPLAVALLLTAGTAVALRLAVKPAVHVVCAASRACRRRKRPVPAPVVAALRRPSAAGRGRHR